MMQILWSRGESSVRDVVRQLDRPLAYTTVMTTLDRLYKKGLLDRYRKDRAFVYSASFSQQSEFDAFKECLRAQKSGPELKRPTLRTEPPNPQPTLKPNWATCLINAIIVHLT